jgi:hypothetical protein
MTSMWLIKMPQCSMASVLVRFQPPTLPPKKIGQVEFIHEIGLENV